MKRYCWIILLAVAAGCGRNVDPVGPLPPDPVPVDPADPPLSGQALTYKNDEAVGSLSFALTTSANLVGCHYTSSVAPDLYFQCNDAIGDQALTKSDRGLNVCRFLEKKADGSLLYAAPEKIRTLWDEDAPLVKIFEDGGDIYGASISQNGTNAELLVAKLSDGTFTETGKSEFYCEYPIVGFDIRRTDKGLEVAFLTYNVTSMEVAVNPDYLLYNGAGIYRGIVPGAKVFYSTLSSGDMSMSVPVAAGDGSSPIIFPADIAIADGGYILLNRFGALKFLPYKEPWKCRIITDSRSEDVQNPSASASLCYFKDGSGNASFIVSGEGSPQWYRMLSESQVERQDVIRTVNGAIYGGNICVPNVYDWNADGALDLVVGNAEGRLLFFRNYGTNDSPSFGQAVEIESDGEPLLVRPGYYCVGGTLESAHGYLCPTVCDWNSDGLPDVVFTSAEGKVEVMLGEGMPSDPKLGPRKILMNEALELYGMWRTRPAVASIDGETYLVISDGDDAAHLYRKENNFNVVDCGTLKLTDGKNIYGHRQDYGHMSEWGRLKFQFVDWDGDGDLDLLVGAAADSCVPDPAFGLPFGRSDKNLQILYLENKGKNSSMRFAYPRQFVFRGVDMYLGDEETSVDACMLGPLKKGLPNLVVGCGSGRIVYINRSDLLEVALW